MKSSDSIDRASRPKKGCCAPTAPNAFVRRFLGWEPTVMFEKNSSLENWAVPDQPPL